MTALMEPTESQGTAVRTPRTPPLPWHLRKRFLLPIIAVLLAGAISSLALLAGAVYTYMRVQQAVSELQAELSQLGLPIGQQNDAAAAPAVPPESDPVSSASNAGETGRVTYVLEGDLDGVVATYVDDADGTTKTGKVSGTTYSKALTIDSTWSSVGVEAHRTSGTGDLACSVLGAMGAVLVEDSSSGKGASVSCHL